VQITGGGLGGGFAPSEIVLEGLAMDPAPPKPGFSPPTFRNMRLITRLIVTISPSIFFPTTEIGNCRLQA